ncbi:hypothetical protein [Pseudomonas segetis]|uniref:Uncharacterized protein n=1 Tax=Pseudomonas segetis TaxID=298908 RepID=A0A239CA34_9PSED|nr:hypothetical protein [Pseudomonas segetis]SNS16538.1 hypothetical protein SAMN05216255_1570 [Pseudomonas segetis]
MTVPTITDDLVAELEAEAKAFDNLDYDSNTNPFFNGPSGESLGGDADGTFCVYGEPFEIDGESYDGVTLVERCSRSQAKFIAEAKVRILALLAERAELKRDAERYLFLRNKYTNPGFMASHDRARKWFSEYMICGEALDSAIDAAMEAKP